MKHIILNLVVVAVAALISNACEPAPDDLFARQFLIRSGDHYSTPRLAGMLQSDRLIFHATFDQSAVYDFGDQALQSNKNKLLGFADCNSLHHENSARFAWQWFNDRLEVYAYCYVNSVRVEEFAGVVNLNETNLYEIRLTDTQYIFYINGKQTNAIGRAVVCDKGLYYMLYPYFGGSVAAPHDVTITVAIDR